MMVSNRNPLFQGLIFRFHVKLRGSKSIDPQFHWDPNLQSFQPITSRPQTLRVSQSPVEVCRAVRSENDAWCQVILVWTTKKHDWNPGLGNFEQGICKQINPLFLGIDRQKLSEYDGPVGISPRLLGQPHGNLPSQWGNASSRKMQITPNRISLILSALKWLVLTFYDPNCRQAPQPEAYLGMQNPSQHASSKVMV